MPPEPRPQPTDPAEIHFKAAWQLRREKKYAEAIEEFLKSLEHQPDKAATHFNLGLMYEQVGQFAAAWKHGMRAHELFADAGDESNRRTAERTLRKLARNHPEARSAEE